MAKKDDDVITPRVLLEHMQAGFESVKTELRSEFRRELRAELRKEIEPLKKAIVQLQKNDERTHYRMRNL